MTEPEPRIPEAGEDTQAPEPATPELRHRHDELAAEITEHNYRYHVLDSPLVDDATYDALMREIRALEDEHPDLRTPDSPARRSAASPPSSPRSSTCCGCSRWTTRSPPRSST